ncbi:MAG TPA: FCD domain-containing protein, partial [Deltaproteobacteria bacterium]|nr:FCD domain-containing protein [Deltaproteobacteria bacterium]
RLESLGVIEIRHGDGAHVQHSLESPRRDPIWAMFYMDDRLDEDLIMTLLEIRLILVPEMAALAASRRDERHARELLRLSSPGTGLSVMERDIMIHRVIAQASGNTLYVVLLNFFNRFFREYGHLYFDNQDNSRRSERFHQDIAHAVAEGDPMRARLVMREVLEYAQKAVLDVVRSGAGEHMERT